MRFSGKIAKWNAERGFGFITPDQGGQELFVHISALPRDGRTPRVGDAVSFEVERAPDGKKRAARVQRPSLEPSLGSFASRTEYRRPRPRPRRWRSAVVVLVLCAIGAYGYQQYQRRVLSAGGLGTGVIRLSDTPVGDSPQDPVFECRGRTHCSQMTSCAEAKWVLKHCPGVAMDGNNDGVPCEQQWCTSPFAK